MWRDFRDLKDRFTGKATLRHCSGWVLCALLLILCVNARLSRYEIHKDTLKLASTQTCLDGEETLKDLSKITPLLWCVGVVAVPVLFRTQALLLAAVMPSSPPFKGFNPEFRLRPPPVQ
jgi:hypothetical protein